MKNDHVEESTFVTQYLAFWVETSYSDSYKYGIIKTVREKAIVLP